MHHVNCVYLSFHKWWSIVFIDPLPAKLYFLNFYPLEVVSRYRDPQLQVGENYSYLFNLKPTFANLDV